LTAYEWASTVNSTETPTPLKQLQFNQSDVILLKVAVNNLKQGLKYASKAFQERLEFILKELNK